MIKTKSLTYQLPKFFSFLNVVCHFFWSHHKAFFFIKMEWNTTVDTLETDVLLFRVFKKKKLVCPIGWSKEWAKTWSPGIPKWPQKTREGPFLDPAFHASGTERKGKVEREVQCSLPHPHPQTSFSQSSCSLYQRSQGSHFLPFSKLPLSGDTRC